MTPMRRYYNVYKNSLLIYLHVFHNVIKYSIELSTIKWRLAYITYWTGPDDCLSINKQHGLNKMAIILQVTFSNAFFLIFEFKVHWNLFPGSLKISQYCLRLRLGAKQATSYKGSIIHWRIYASIGLDDLTHWGLRKMVDNLPKSSNAFSW